MKLRISSRQSVLAKTQAYQVGSELERAHPGLGIDYLFRESLGDKNLTDPLWKMPEKGVFTEDFYLDLVQDRTDLVVHSWKDLPTEEKPDTKIVATLPRADQRDLLLFKKKSKGKTALRIYSSSPRRAHNLKEFLGWALPWRSESLEFTSVRGNIPTRVQKLLEDPEIDGLILAKAALDRLLVDQKFPETIEFLRKSLEQCQWMVLPLSENPNAAAQGALAIEVANHRDDVLEFVQKINCAKTYQAAAREREILKEFGGGCHLALGMSVLDRPYGRIEFVRGLSPSGERIEIKRFLAKKARPENLKAQHLEFTSSRTSKDVKIEGVNALYVAKADAWPVGTATDSKFVWTAGVKTWKKLAGLGVWVHGSSEGLGEIEDSRIEILTGGGLQWGRVSHDSAAESVDKKQFGTYHLDLTLLSKELDSSPAFIWKSASEFLTAIQKFPQLKNRSHICGPGRTYETVRQHLGSDENIYIEINLE